MNGKVGVGTTAPDAILTSNQSGNLTVGSPSTYGFLVQLNGSANISIGARRIRLAHPELPKQAAGILNDAANNAS